MKMCTYCTQQRLAAVIYLYSVTSGLFATLNPLKPCPKFNIHGCSHSGYETRIFRIYFRNINENKFFSCRQLSIKWSAFCSPSSRRLNCRPSNWLPCIKPYQCQISLEMEATILGILLDRGGRLKFLSEHLSFIKSWTSSFWQKWRDWRLEQGVPWTFGPNFCSYLKSIYDILKSFFFPVLPWYCQSQPLNIRRQLCFWTVKAVCLPLKLHQLNNFLPCWSHAEDVMLGVAVEGFFLGRSSCIIVVVLPVSSWWVTFLQILPFFKSALSSNALHQAPGSFFKCASVFLLSNVSSNSPLLQKCFFFKCAPPDTRLFLPMRQCILAEWRFFKCAPSSKVLSSNAFLLQMHSTRHRGQLTHWSWQCRLHYHGPRNSGRKWLQPLEL